MHGGTRPAVDGAGGAVYHLDRVGRAHRPSQAPTRIAEALRETVYHEDGILLDVVHIPRRRDRAVSRLAIRRVYVVGVELVEEQRAVLLARDVDVTLQLFALHELSGGIARVADEIGPKILPAHDRLEVFARRDKALLRCRGYENRIHAIPVVVQHVLVRCVVGNPVADIHRTERREHARQHEPAARSDAHVRPVVLGLLSLPVQPVVVLGYDLAQLVGAADRAVRVIVRLQLDRGESLRCALHRPDFGLALAEVGPVGVAVAEAELHGFGYDPDDAHVRNGAERFASCLICCGQRGSHLFLVDGIGRTLSHKMRWFGTDCERSYGSHG